MALQANILGLQSNLPAGCTLLAIDNTNYDTNGQTRFARALFNNLYVWVTRPDASEYVFGSGTLIAVDETISDPSGLSAPQQITYNFISTDVNGTWQVDMVTIPDHSAGQTYFQDEVVVYNGQVWQNTLATNNTLPSVPNGWQVVTVASLRSGLSPFDSGMNVTIDCRQSLYYQTSMHDVATDVDLLDVNATCSGLAFTDNSNWDENNEEGHALADFSNYRRVVLTRPLGGQYIYSFIAGDDVDEIIAPASSGNQQFTYSFIDTDVDGRYQVRICEYPTWGITYNYSASRLTVVYYDGVLYRCITSNVGSQPDTNPTDWEVYEPTEEQEAITRYCYTANVAILCISLDECMETKNHEAVCLIQSNFCNDDYLCKNKAFMDYIKLRIYRDGIEYAMYRRAWSEVDADFNSTRQICNC